MLTQYKKQPPMKIIRRQHVQLAGKNNKFQANWCCSWATPIEIPNGGFPNPLRFLTTARFKMLVSHLHLSSVHRIWRSLCPPQFWLISVQIRESWIHLQFIALYTFNFFFSSPSQNDDGWAKRPWEHLHQIDKTTRQNPFEREKT